MKDHQAANTIVIQQPYFLPYRAYFGLVAKANHFVIYDDVQFCRGWQQRNCIPTPWDTKIWLTIPVMSARPNLQKIRDVRIVMRPPWQGRMLARIRQCYQNHPYFESLYPELKRNLKKPVEFLTDLTVPLIEWSAEAAGLRLPRWHRSSDLKISHPDRTQRLVMICQEFGADRYLCGPAAKVYLREESFHRAGINLLWHEDSYPAYPQQGTDSFDHHVSILDLLMNCGPGSSAYVEPLAQT